MRHYKLLGDSMCFLQSMSTPVSHKWFDNHKLYGEAKPYPWQPARCKKPS
jgi:hypothetical protein